ncbi:NnrU family protein [Roseovarius sp. Pro17]|uniref:NnrU family protein n=1 Tax=Roseovarius sp. Pro17 TaxID=3108175 RepID=UPI002D791E80|nr:NnrU family protein [Roseovarius sp. Pro17]
MGWLEFAAAFAAFFITHSLPMRPKIRAKLVGLVGRRGFLTLYSVLSLGMLAWLIVAAANAPYVVLWHRAPWQTWVPLFAMAGVCALLCLSIARPNPLSFGGARNDLFDPAHPGIIRLVRHPLLLALTLWAAAHLVANGDLAHVILFGVFAGFALLGMRIVDRRKRREMGAGQWAALRAQIASGPLMPRPASWRGGALRLMLAGGLYAVLIALHPALLGVTPLP